MKCPRCGTEFYGDKCPSCGYEPSDYNVSLDTLMRITGVGKKRAEELYRAGYRDIESIAKSDENDLAKVRTIGPELARRIREEAKKFVEEEPEEFVKICPVCGAIVPPDADKCPKCGTLISGHAAEENVEVGEEKGEEMTLEDKAICAFCGALIPRDSKVCPICGANLENVSLEEPRPMEDPGEVLKRFFGVSEIPTGVEEEEENADIRVCPNCGAIVVNRDTCPFCGTPLAEVTPSPISEEEIDLSERLNVCPNCGAFISPDAKVCPICGSVIEEEREEEEIGVSLADLLQGGLGATAVAEEVSEEEFEREEAQQPAVVEKSQEEISLEELEEIEQSIAPELEEITEEIVDEGSMESIIEEQEGAVAASDLDEIEELLEEEKGRAQEKKEMPPVPGPLVVGIPEKKTPAREEEIEKNVGYGLGERLNAFLMNFGTVEDTLSFSPLFVILIYVLSSGAMGDAALGILQQTTSIFMGFLSVVLGINAYRTAGRFSRRELLYGLGSSLAILSIFAPYSVYLAISLSVLLVFLHMKRPYDYWIPYVGISALSMFYLSHAVELAFLAMAMFSAHLISRYEEMAITVRHEESMSVGKLYEMGMAAFSEKRYYDAIYYLRRVLKNRPEDVNVINTLGLAYGRIGNTDMALEMFRKAVTINPGYKVAWNNMGNVYARMENYDEAMRCYRKALQIDPNYEDALLNMGYVMIRRGDYSEAMRIAEKMKATLQT